MNISPQFAKALVKFRAELKPAIKDASNPFFKSQYADLASIIEASKNPLSDNGLSFLQIVHDAEAAKVETIIVHESGEMISCGIVAIPPTKKDPQGYGSAITYARRYSLQSALGIPTEDDDGNQASAPKSAPKAPIAAVWYDFNGLNFTQEQLEYLKRRNCQKDEPSGLWFAPNQLGGDKEGYRTEPPMGR